METKNDGRPSTKPRSMIPLRQRNSNRFPYTWKRMDELSKELTPGLDSFEPPVPRFRCIVFDPPIPIRLQGSLSDPASSSRQEVTSTNLGLLHFILEVEALDDKIFGRVICPTLKEPEAFPYRSVVTVPGAPRKSFVDMMFSPRGNRGFRELCSREHLRSRGGKIDVNWNLEKVQRRDRSRSRVPDRKHNHVKEAHSAKPKKSTTKDAAEPNAKRTGKSEDEDFTCCICYDAIARIVFLPCAHQVCCENCSMRIRTCPICRSYIISRINTYR